MLYGAENRKFKSIQKKAETYKPFEYMIDGIKKVEIPLRYGYGGTSKLKLFDIYVIQSESENRRYVPIVPDCCNTMVIFCKENQANGYICGNIEEIKKIYIDPGESVILVRFIPGVGHSLLQEKQKKGNAVVNLEASMKNGSKILDVASGDLPVEQRAGLIGSYIMDEIRNEKRLYLVNFCTEKILDTNGQISISELAEDTGFSERYISKMFDTYIGMPPKSFSQIIRFQATMKRISSGVNEVLANVAVDNGFFDHAHMNRAYNKYIHLSSGEFRRKELSNVDYNAIDEYICAV